MELKRTDSIHLAIDAVGAKHGGAATVMIDVLNAAIGDPRVARITLFCSPSEKRMFKIPSSAKLIEVPKPWIDKSKIFRLGWYELLLGLESRRVGADILFVVANFGRARFGMPHVTFVQQPLPFIPEAWRYLSIIKRFKVIIYKIEMRRSCQSAVMTICQSAVMKDALVATFNLDPAKVTTVYPSPKELRPTEAEGLQPCENGQPSPTRRLLYVGSDIPQKRIGILVEGLKLIREIMPHVEAILTLPKDHVFSVEPGTRCLGYVDDQNLIKAYVTADALVLPSVAETVGMPTLEAMSLGTPVLVADRPYAHDICEDAALFFDPNSPADLAEKAIRLLTDDALRQTLIDRGRKVVEKRRDEHPYKKMVDICVDVALKVRRKLK